MDYAYYLIKAKCRLLRKSGPETCERINDHFRKMGMTIGSRCRIYSAISTSESYLVKIGNDVTISNDVQLLTHDNAIIKVYPECTNLFGKVDIGDNCFIGAHSVILPGVTIGNNSIVGAGSVVTNSVPEGTIVAGNPAREIGKTSKYGEKYKEKAFNIEGLNESEIKSLILNHSDKLIVK